MARVPVSTLLMCAVVLVLLVTPCTSTRNLRDDAGRSLSEDTRKTVKRSTKESGDDAVPTSAKLPDYKTKYNEWVRFQTQEVTLDYEPAAANPSVPCCTP